MSEKEENVPVNSETQLWFAGDLKKVTIAGAVLLLLALVLFVLNFPYWYFVLWFMAIMGVCVAIVSIFGVFFIKVDSKVQNIVSSSVYPVIQNIGKKIDDNSTAKDWCIKPTTWIITVFFIIFDVFIVYSYFPLTDNEISIHLVKEIVNKALFFAVVNVCAIERFLSKYSVDIKELDGRIYYQGRLMSKIEKIFLKLARILYLYISISGFVLLVVYFILLFF